MMDDSDTQEQAQNSGADDDLATHELPSRDDADIKANSSTESSDIFQQQFSSAEKNTLIARDIFFSHKGAEAEVALHIVRAWQALALVAEPAKAAEALDQSLLLESIETDEIFFPNYLSVKEWRETILFFRSELGSPSPAQFDRHQIEKHIEFLEEHLPRVRSQLIKQGKLRRSFSHLLKYRYHVAGVVGLAALAWLGSILLKPALDPGSGPWRAQYHRGIELKGEPISRFDEILDFDWTTTDPFEGFTGKNMSVSWDSCLVLDKSTPVTFELGSDDGSRMFLNDEQLINLWYSHPFETRTVEKTLPAGKHHLKVEFFEVGGSALLRFKAKVGDGPFSADIREHLEQPNESDSANPCG